MNEAAKVASIQKRMKRFTFNYCCNNSLRQIIKRLIGFFTKISLISPRHKPVIALAIYV